MYNFDEGDQFGSQNEIHSLNGIIFFLNRWEYMSSEISQTENIWVYMFIYYILFISEASIVW